VAVHAERAAATPEPGRGQAERDALERDALDRAALDRELAERIDETERMRELARSMADARDTEELLQILVRSAAEQCVAAASAVTRVQDGKAEIIAADGEVRAFCGASFPVAGTLTARAIDERMTVMHDDYVNRADRVVRSNLTPTPMGEDFKVGAIVITPLVTQGDVMGVLSVMRHAGDPPFTPREQRRLEVLADYASIALKKSRLFEAAEAANQAKSTFLATMSHELRTPLTALTGYGELLADEIVGPLTPLQHDTVERMRAVTHHLTVMIDEILTFSSIEAGRETVTSSSVLPSAVLRSVSAVVEPLARKKAVEFEVSADESIAPITSDPDKLRQILVNLAGNAIKFTDTGFVRLSVSELEGAVRFTVTDSGIGISKSDLARLFQPFTQVDAGLTRRHGGTGLGLYISNRLAALLGGHIEVHSEPGKGSTFVLIVPR
jgi:signal transduction histidine kinase